MQQSCFPTFSLGLWRIYLKNPYKDRKKKGNMIPKRNLFFLSSKRRLESQVMLFCIFSFSERIWARGLFRTLSKFYDGAFLRGDNVSEEIYRHSFSGCHLPKKYLFASMKLFKMIENAFYFILNALFVLKIRLISKFKISHLVNK